MTAIVNAKDITVSVLGKKLIKNVSVQLTPGLVTGIIGPNGAGKSTLLAALAGDIATTSGTITIGGKDITRYTPRELARQRAVMLQDVGVSFSYLVRDIVEMGRSPYPADPGDPQRVDHALRTADVAHLQDRIITNLSGGERARVAFARVLCQDTPVVMLDEPTAALDIKHQEQLLSTARDLARRGVAVAVVLHDLNLAAAYCDSITLLKAGSIYAQGTPQEVLNSTLLTDAYECPISVTHPPSSPDTLLISPVRG
ncbi:heme ABC transporter ATP-binding protein [Corynebacterium hindlerae]|uniref:heme ABC transporter ATP-binding protein n=1 Tax=Corynebacterium hindlerae TaxID=699041 RepID=UPI001E2CB26F|nr:heme ABC transporter ATP-binding protein [Corynebacterium hindlerae]